MSMRNGVTPKLKLTLTLTLTDTEGAVLTLMLGYSLQKFIHYMAIATFVIADCRRISYLSNKAGAKTGGFRLLGSGFREFEWISWISIIRQTG